MCLRNGSFPLECKKDIVRNNLSKNIPHFQFYLFVGKYSNACFMTLYFFFCMNNLRSTNQSGFRPKDSSISQLQSILSAFDMGLEVCGIFLAISKAFDKVWHDEMVFKLWEHHLRIFFKN